MSVSARLRNSLGFLTVLASFALASPGVQVVKAEPLASKEAAAQCQAGAAGAAAQAAQVQDFLARVRAEHGQAGGGEGPEIMVLNNRGYNYGSGPRMDLDRVLIEAQQQRR